MDPFPAWMERLWDAWDVRVMVLFSLILQIVLIILGSRRRYVAGLWIRVIIWSAYLMADWVATVALSKLTDNATEGDSKNNNNDCKQSNNDSLYPHHVIRVLWAPLLLLHLGGPDKITAYSMEDNQLWLRHALGLVVQVVVVIYIFLRFWTGSWLSILTFPMFVAGIIKYAERVWVLWSTNNEQPQESEQSKDGAVPFLSKLTEEDIDWIRGIPGLELLLRGFLCFYIFKPHIANYVCSYLDMLDVNSVTNDQSTENVLRVIDFELGFMYDVLYTKAAIIYTTAGCILRSISFFCTVSVLLGFSIITKDEYSKVDLFITYLLLVGAVVLDIYAATQMVCSEWAILWMTKHHKKQLVTRILRVLAPLSLEKRKRWSNSIAQFSLLNFCLYTDKATPFSRILKFFGMDEKLKEHRCQTHVNITKDLKGLLEEQIRETLLQTSTSSSLPYSRRGEWALERYQRHHSFKWSFQEDFDKSITIWHIATDICYYLDSAHLSTNQEEKSRSEATKLVSDYMMYLLVKHPYMLSIANWQFMFEHNSTDIMKILKESGSPLTNQAEACETLLKVRHGVEEVSALKHAQELAEILISDTDRWKILSGVWIEMLYYAATHCQVNHHAQELRRGGEFLTHIWLLLTNLCLTEKFNKTSMRDEEQV